MKLNGIYKAFLFLTCLMFLSSCGNDDKPENKTYEYSYQFPVLEISCSVDNGEKEPYVIFEYDIYNRITHVTFDDFDMYNFSYDPLNIVCNQFEGISHLSIGKNGYISEVTINDEGQAISLSCEYDKHDHLVSLTRTMGNLSYVTSIEWKNSSIVAVATRPKEGGMEDYPLYSHTAQCSVENSRLQWTTAVAQMIGEEDAFFPLALCGFFGKAPEYLPTMITSKSENNSVVTNFTYMFNNDGTIAIETGEEKYYFHERNMTMYYRYK